MVRILKDALQVYSCTPDLAAQMTTVPGGLGLELMARPEADLEALAAEWEAQGVDCTELRRFITAWQAGAYD